MTDNQQSGNNIGLQAVLENKDFKRGIEEMIAGSKKATEALEEMAQKTTGATVKSTTSTKQAGDQSAMSFGVMAAAAGGAAGAIVAGAAQIKRAVDGMIDKFKELAKEILLISSRFRELELSARAVGAIMGIEQNEIQSTIDALEKLGIRRDTASSITAEFTRNNLELAKAIELANFAQDNAVLTQKDSTETLEALLQGILTQRTQVLKTNRVLIDANEAYRKFAEANNIAVGSMTSAQKSQALLNEILEGAPKIAGLYELSMQSLGKQLRTLTGREIPTLMAALGDPFQRAGATMVKAVRNIVNAFTSLLRENEEVRGSLARIGALLQVVARAYEFFGEKILGGLDEGATGIASFFNNTIDFLQDMAVEFLRWGWKIVLSLAEGMIRGAAHAITAVATAINKLLTFWFRPQSPPNVAPDIDKWGEGTMEEFLKGFAKADFDILNDLQGPIRQALQNLIGMGEMDEDVFGDMFVKLSKEVAKATRIFDKAGVFDPKTFKKIEKAVGKYGKEISKLLKDQLKLAKVVKDIATQEEELEDAREDRETAQTDLNDLTREYNDLLRTGATQDVLDAQLALINASKNDLDLALDREQAAEAQLELLKEQKDILQEMADTQKALVDELLELDSVTIDTSKMSEDIAGAITDAFSGLPLPDPEEMFPEMESLIQEILDEWKSEFGGVWAEIADQWNTEVVPAIDELEKAMGLITGIPEEWRKEFLKVKVWLNNEVVIPYLTAMADIGEAMAPINPMWGEVARVAKERIGEIMGETRKWQWEIDELKRKTREQKDEAGSMWDSWKEKMGQAVGYTQENAPTLGASLASGLEPGLVAISNTIAGLDQIAAKMASLGGGYNGGGGGFQANYQGGGGGNGNSLSALKRGTNQRSMGGRNARTPGLVGGPTVTNNVTVIADSKLDLPAVTRAVTANISI